MSDESKRLLVFFSDDPVIGLPRPRGLEIGDKIEFKGAPTPLKMCFPVMFGGRVKMTPETMATNGSVDVGISKDSYDVKLMKFIKTDTEYKTTLVDWSQSVLSAIANKYVTNKSICWDSVGQRFVVVLACFDLTTKAQSTRVVGVDPVTMESSILFSPSDSDVGTYMTALVTRDGVSHLVSCDSACNKILNLTTGAVTARATPLGDDAKYELDHSDDSTCTMYQFPRSSGLGFSKVDPLTGAVTSIDAGARLNYGGMICISDSKVITFTSDASLPQVLTLYVDGASVSTYTLPDGRFIVGWPNTSIGGDKVAFSTSGVDETVTVLSVAGDVLAPVSVLPIQPALAACISNTSGGYAVIGEDSLIDFSSGAQIFSESAMFYMESAPAPMQLSGLYPAFYIANVCGPGHGPKHFSVLVSLADGGKWAGQLIPKNATIKISGPWRARLPAYQMNGYINNRRWNIPAGGMSSSCVLQGPGRLIELIFVPDQGKNA